ncbi:MAG TPA: hypothetical protein P5121_37420, partial [Caldilineaceae bacterium]|nr:hypothetical protein [Caldilineaceae bacterium]
MSSPSIHGDFRLDDRNRPRLRLALPFMSTSAAPKTLAITHETTAVPVTLTYDMPLDRRTDIVSSYEFNVDSSELQVAPVFYSITFLPPGETGTISHYGVTLAFDAAMTEDNQDGIFIATAIGYGVEHDQIKDEADKPLAVITTNRYYYFIGAATFTQPDPHETNGNGIATMLSTELTIDPQDTARLFSAWNVDPAVWLASKLYHKRLLRNTNPNGHIVSLDPPLALTYQTEIGADLLFRVNNPSIGAYFIGHS